MFRKTAIALTTAAIASAAPGAAQAGEFHVGATAFRAPPKAPGTLVGVTSQSPCDEGSPTCGVVNVLPHRNGRSIRQVGLGWEASCEDPGAVMGGVAVARAVRVKRAATGSSFKLARTYTADVGGGYTADVEDRFTGRLDKRGRTARGTYSVVAVVTRNGEQVDRCASGAITWKAQRMK